MDFAIYMGNSSVDLSTISFGLRQAIDTMRHLLLKQLSSMADTKDKEVRELEEKIQSLFHSFSYNRNQNVVSEFQKLSTLPRDSHADIKQLISRLELIETNESSIRFQDRIVKKNTQNEIHIILDNIRSANNVGNIIRSAEALGVKTIHLCGFTPDHKNEKVLKSSLGCEEWIDIQVWESVFQAIESLSEKGIKVIAFETSKNSLALKEVQIPETCAFVFGNERFGLSEAVLNICDHTVEIKLFGKKNSLNVTNAVAIALNHIMA
ncbi:MAG: RNA methyltransferase [Oligoflexia bacterium]|nr:RNA methyltransferase [Oligoflexia bacterium]